MRDRTVTALIDRIVADARIPLARQRDELRRELAAHFDDADADAGAIDRFGDPDLLAGSWRRVYRHDRTLVYLAKLALSIVASLGAAMAIALATAFPAGVFAYRAVPAAIFVVLLIALREATRPFAATLAIARLRAFATTIGPAKLAQMFGVLMLAEYALHAGRGLAFGVDRVALAAAVLVAVWAATVVIGSRIDRLFGDRFMTA